MLVVRWLAGKYIVNQLVANDSMRPAVHNAWQIITKSLAAAGWVALAVGILVAIGAWLVGPGDRATSARVALAPHSAADRVAWGGLRRRDAADRLDPPDRDVPNDRRPVVAAAIGFFIFRRQLHAESPRCARDDCRAACVRRTSRCD